MNDLPLFSALDGDGEHLSPTRSTAEGRSPRGNERREGQSLAELTQIMAAFPRPVDDQSAEFMAKLRDAGQLADADWTRVLGWLDDALHFLAGPNLTVTHDANGGVVVDPDADPRDANWLRIAGANRHAGHHLPMWAAMWLWRIGHDRGPDFWGPVRSAAANFGCQSYSPE